MLDANDKLVAEISPTTTFAAAYKEDTGFPVSGTVSGDTIVLRAPATPSGSAPAIDSSAPPGYALAGPSEATEITIGRIMRTVDATPPFETTLAEADVARSG